MALHILIADDEPLVRKGLRLILKKSHLPVHNVLEATNGTEALRLAQQYSPQIVVLDIKMPGCNGLEAMKQIRQSLPETKIVVLSAYSYFEYAQEALRYGALDYLIKPVQPEEIVKVLCRCLKKQKPLGPVRKEEKVNIASWEKDVSFKPAFPHKEHLVALIREGDAISACYKMKSIFQELINNEKSFSDLSAQTAGLVFFIVRIALESGADEQKASDLQHQILCKIFQARDEEDLLQLLKQAVYEVTSLLPCGKEPRNRRLISIAEQYIRDHLAENLTLKEVAGQVYLSPAYFSAFFKRETGENFSSYLNKIRIENAKEMMADETLTLRFISHKVGFSDESYFNRIFKKITGVTPGEYRRQRKA